MSDSLYCIWTTGKRNTLLKICQKNWIIWPLKFPRRIRDKIKCREKRLINYHTSNKKLTFGPLFTYLQRHVDNLVTWTLLMYPVVLNLTPNCNSSVIEDKYESRTYIKCFNVLKSESREPQCLEQGHSWSLCLGQNRLLAMEYKCLPADKKILLRHKSSTDGYAKTPLKASYWSHRDMFQHHPVTWLRRQVAVETNANVLLLELNKMY